MLSNTFRTFPFSSSPDGVKVSKYSISLIISSRGALTHNLISFY